MPVSPVRVSRQLQDCKRLYDAIKEAEKRLEIMRKTLRNQVAELNPAETHAYTRFTYLRGEDHGSR